jgi:hypothetical protein
MLFNLLLFKCSNSNLLFIDVVRAFYIVYWCYIILFNPWLYMVLFKRFINVFDIVLHNYLCRYSIVVVT